MIRSEILQEKDEIQAKLSEECDSIHDYLVKSHLAADKVATSYGFTLKYADLPTLTLHRTSLDPGIEDSSSG